MDFAALPPEINSGRMYTGPGAAPMLAAAMAWDALAVALHSAADSYQAEVTALTGGPWLGPSAAAMSAAAAQYVAWTRTAAAQAEQTAGQAKAAAAAYEAAFAESVPPPVIAANRSLLMSLIATNILGQNTPAIATTEAQYSEMWAQDAGAMYGYAASASAAARLTPFAPPQESTDSGGSVRQAAALNQAAGTSAGKVQSALSPTQQAFTATPDALLSLASPLDLGFGGRDLLGLAADLSAVFVDPEVGTAGLAAAVVALPYDVSGALTGFHTDDIVSGWAGVQSWPGWAPVPPTPFPVITNLAGGSAATASLGQANMVGGLSVPPGWAAAAPAVRPAALALPATTVGAAAQASSGGSGSLFGEMAAASMAGRAMAGTTGAGLAGRAERLRAATQKATQDGTAAPQVPAGGPITSIAAELRELASLRDAGIITEDEFNEQKQRLLPH
ncbi:PPE family protein, SVP subgroup [Mycobacterium paraffinicum]|uniref:PPE family protein n=1 Tax=Mycobacterium paraffinicum TaxID=53378 RepID=A0ABP8RD25_9MYCO|nr:PPE domain-containing protein [Mycobacterium paraffinicum]MCV7313788.1 PPE domain-containing protein [Mycobacterium paraffinicum]